jgi:hypothetical protein
MHLRLKEGEAWRRADQHGAVDVGEGQQPTSAACLTHVRSTPETRPALVCWGCQQRAMSDKTHVEHNESALTLIADIPGDMDFYCNGPAAVIASHLAPSAPLG